MNFLAHAVAQSGINQLVTLHAVSAFESLADHYSLEMLAVASDFQVLAGQAGAYSEPHAIRCNHGLPFCREPDLTAGGEISAEVYTPD
jgi:hypothetical protein